LNSEIDVFVSSLEELKRFIEDEKVLYIVDENGEEVFYDELKTFSAIMEF
jgi:uncharacterized protein YrzB (UPF0473 family)